MLMTLEEAQKIYPDATQVYLDGLETGIREYTNNPFQNKNVRFAINRLTGDSIVLKSSVFGLRSGDTIQVSSSQLNDGLYVVHQIQDNVLTVQDGNLYAETPFDAVITKVVYPADVISGIVKILRYDNQMKDKLGIKSESISRLSVTYYDVNSSENTEGYPKSLLSFLDKYMMLRW